jgi:DNA helicase-2/ATP-dependent DNA helicase PcrA
MGLANNAKDDVLDILRTTKQQALTDDQVAAALNAYGNQISIDLERKRIAEGLATYDDLLRYAELILANEAVANLYRNHFGVVVVDEYQDLTPQQLHVVTRIGQERITFAGDLAQGIYGFAGATPVAIDAVVRAAVAEVIDLNESHRSSPAVLDLVCSLNHITGGQDLQCADPSSWPNGGLSALATFRNTESESAALTRLARRILAQAPNHRIGIISRVKSRLRLVESAIEASGLPFYRWEDGILDSDTAKLVRSLLRRVDTPAMATATDKLAHLRDLAGFDRVEEPDTRKALADALGWVLDRLNEGLAPPQIAARIRVGDATTLLNAPGVHLLSGHVGKGQQFDWVVVVGAEDGNIPFFLAKSDAERVEETCILSVMLSRARHGVLVTYTQSVPTIAGTPRDRDLSPLW